MPDGFAHPYSVALRHATTLRRSVFVRRSLTYGLLEVQMPRRKRVATSGYVFHVLNRATARRRIFDTDGDCGAFVPALCQSIFFRIASNFPKYARSDRYSRCRRLYEPVVFWQTSTCGLPRCSVL